MFSDGEMYIYGQKLSSSKLSTNWGNADVQSELELSNNPDL